MLLVAACGDDKNTSDSDTSTGATMGASTSTGDTTGTTDGSSGDDGGTEPTTAGTSEPGTTGSTTHSSVTGESSSGADTSGTSGSDGGDSSGTSGGLEPAGTAVVEDACAPNDGPAVQFRFEVSEPVCGAQSTGEGLHLFLWQGGPLAPGDYSLTEQMGFASYQVGNDEPTNSVDGTLTIDSWVGDLVIGSYQLNFVDDSTREGVFAGPFCQTNPPCG